MFNAIGLTLTVGVGGGMTHGTFAFYISSQPNKRSMWMSVNRDWMIRIVVNTP